MLCALALLLQAPDARTVARQVRGLFVEGRWEEALGAYQRMPAPPPSPAPNDREAIRAYAEYRDIRSAARWEAAQCHARLGRWEEALRAFQEARTLWPRTSWCGNGAAQIAAEQDVAEGLCLERLGRHAEALERYVRAAGRFALTPVERPAARIVELYSAAGALDALEGRMARMDLEHRRKLDGRPGGLDDVERAMKHAPSAPLRPFWEAARATPGAWTSRRPDPPGELPFPPIPQGLKLP